MKNWYCLQTKHRQEEAAAAALKARGYFSYCPLTLTDKRKKRRITPEATFMPITEPLFPLYLFVQMSEGIDDFYPITKTPGIVNIVKMTRRDDGYLYPSVIMDEIIQALRELEDEQGIHSKYQTDYLKGDKVRVVRGIFKDFTAEIATMSRVQRVDVLIEMMGSYRNIELHYRDIEPVMA
jgi:transcriptional antiterminator RfaH